MGIKDSNARQDLEKEEMEEVQRILGDEIPLEEFIDKDIDQIKNINPSQKKKLERLQIELTKLHDADVDQAIKDPDARQDLEKEEMEEVQRILGDKIPLEEFIDKDINKIKDINPS